MTFVTLEEAKTITVWLNTFGKLWKVPDEMTVKCPACGGAGCTRCDWAGWVGASTVAENAGKE
jgi:hypothetical protein